jgi:hypothetical protein
MRTYPPEAEPFTVLPLFRSKHTFACEAVLNYLKKDNRRSGTIFFIQPGHQFQGDQGPVPYRLNA